MKRNKKFYQEKKFRKAFKDMINEEDWKYIKQQSNHTYNGFVIDERYCPITEEKNAKELLKVINLQTPFFHCDKNKEKQFLGINALKLIKQHGFYYSIDINQLELYDDCFIDKYFIEGIEKTIPSYENNWTEEEYLTMKPNFPLNWFKFDTITNTYTTNKRIFYKDSFNYHKWDKVVYHNNVTRKLYWKNKRRYDRADIFWIGYDKYLDKKYNTTRYSTNYYKKHIVEKELWEHKYSTWLNMEKQKNNESRRLYNDYK